MTLNIYYCGQAYADYADMGLIDADGILSMVSRNQLAAVGTGQTRLASIKDAISCLEELGAPVTADLKDEFLRGVDSRNNDYGEWFAIVEYYDDRDTWGQV